MIADLKPYPAMKDSGVSWFARNRTDRLAERAAGEPLGKITGGGAK